ncbi:hypothetical protein GJ654_12420 [Rhodoblastus acidophilus]|uniref:Methyl-accepting chemotaxis protein n=1 Tax=Rhodoblastus acidophilus TaxID=1074 RepID=A0A6N8DRI9_RHOAC|nr:methyl-accepting chemotaxis protein [Rhodoblastus acidophilus]MTV31791.1 hypothetical protein [Rhodoblastus acidophilus]
MTAVQSASDEARRAIGEIEETIEHVDQFSSAISAAVVQQGEATDEIARSIVVASQGSEQLATSVGQVHRSTEDTQMSADAVGEVARDLARLSELLSRNIEGFLSGIDMNIGERAA